MGDKSGTFSYNPDAGLWEAAAVNDSKGPAPPLSGPSLLCLSPRVLVLPQGVTRFTATLKGRPPRCDADRGLKLEAVLGGAALPIRVLPSTYFLTAPSPNFELASSMTFRASEESTPPSGGGGEGPEAVWTLQLEVDLDGARPGLMQLNLWSSTPPAGALLASEKVLLLRSGLEQLAVDLVDEGCGEDLLADLADVLEVPVRACLGTARLMVLTDTAEGLLEWSEEAGLTSLERLVLEQLYLIAERLSAVQAAAAAVEHSAAPVAAGSRQEPSVAECGAASQQANVVRTAATSHSSVPSPGGAWPMIMLIGIVPAIIRSFTDGRGERERRAGAMAECCMPMMLTDINITTV